MAKIKTYNIEARSDEKYKVAVTAGERTLYVDQPLFAGGGDAGATPMDYLLASLAGCLATTARIVANQRKLNLNGMDIRIESSMDLEVIYGKSRENRPGISGIKVRVKLDSEMPERERETFWEEVRCRCPVLDTIAERTPVALAVA